MSCSIMVNNLDNSNQINQDMNLISIHIKQKNAIDDQLQLTIEPLQDNRKSNSNND
jgi:hypothetical protein